MKFKTEAQKACYEKVLPWLRDLPNDVALDNAAENPTFYVTAGSACVLVEILPWQRSERREDTIINTRSYVVTQVSLAPDLMEYLLRENDRLLFGAFGIDEDGDIFLEQTILGSDCDRSELEASVRAILALADDYDDVIVQRWGGRRALDRQQGDRAPSTDPQLT